MKKYKIIIALLLLVSMATFAHSYTRDYDVNDPLDHTLNSKWPAEIREVMADVAERLTYLYGFSTGETAVGAKKIPFEVQAGDPGAIANQIQCYAKDATAKAELYCQDEDADVIQITTGGKINAEALSGTALPAIWQDKVYPVGHIYISTVSTNPNTLLGFGTWAAWGAGKVIVGLNGADADFDTSEETGGAKTVDSSHAHSVPVTGWGVTGGALGSATSGRMLAGTGTTESPETLESVKAAGAAQDSDSGGSTTLAIVQPYIVAYLWERTS